MKTEENLTLKLLEAVLKNDETAIRNVIAEGADINEVYKEKKMFGRIETYCTALELAIDKNLYDLIPFLLEPGSTSEADTTRKIDVIKWGIY
ncbi:hypothetical protein [Paenibacillus sp. MMO-58]|uniref:hypothetical protein n=1 Tax=Paenibacillus sp. MMO-58 TaxID=3081290 RepID=UPI0030175232